MSGLAAIVTQSLTLILAPSSFNSFASPFGAPAIFCHVAKLATIVTLHAAPVGLSFAFTLA
jgi:hypothetical protein